MNEAGQILMQFNVLQLLKLGLRPNLARPLSGMRTSKLKALARDIHGESVSLPPGPAPSGMTRMLHLAGIFHATIFMECVEKTVPLRHRLEEHPGRAEVTIFYHAWKSYKALLARGRFPFHQGAFNINEACSIYNGRSKLKAEACGTCRSKMYRLASGKGPVSCPLCYYARRLGIDMGKGNLVVQLVERRRALLEAGKLRRRKPKTVSSLLHEASRNAAGTVAVPRHSLAPPGMAFGWYEAIMPPAVPANDMLPMATPEPIPASASVMSAQAGSAAAPMDGDVALPDEAAITLVAASASGPPEQDEAVWDRLVALGGNPQDGPWQVPLAVAPLPSSLASAGISWPPAAALPIVLRPPYARGRGAALRAWWTGPAWPWPVGASPSVSPSPRGRIWPASGQRAASAHPSPPAVCHSSGQLRAVGPPSSGAASIQRRMDHAQRTGQPSARALCPAVGPPPRARRVGRMATADPPHRQGCGLRGPPCPGHDVKALRRAS